MTFNKAIEETTLWTHGGGRKTKHDPKRNKFASKNIHIKDYEAAIKGKKPYMVWIHPIKGTI